MGAIELTVRAEHFALRDTFRISRGAKDTTEVVVAELGDSNHIGRGECGPNARYGETVAGVEAAIAAMASALAAGLDRAGLQTAMPSGAARNALDCAFWDLEAKRAGRRVWQLAELAEPAALTTAFTLSIDAADAVAAVAETHRELPILKLKLDGRGDLARIEAARRGAPDARLIVDANEAWTPGDYIELSPLLDDLGVELIEQPLPAGDDAALGELAHPVPVCADEACHDRASLAGLVGKYDAINIKLDKTGGLTEALALAAAASAAGFDLMVGCMVATSLAMAPAMLVAGYARHVDLDGPLLLAHDRAPGLDITNGVIQPAAAAVWG